MSVKIRILTVGITVDQSSAKINKRILGGYKNDFSKICKRTKESRC